MYSSATKYEATLFNLNGKKADWRPRLRINNVNMAVNTFPTFLGVKMDRQLIFTAHTHTWHVLTHSEENINFLITERHR